MCEDVAMVAPLTRVNLRNSVSVREECIEFFAVTSQVWALRPKCSVSNGDSKNYHRYASLLCRFYDDHKEVA